MSPPKRLADLYAIQRERRDERIRAQRARGWTLQRIADKHGLTRARVHQIVNGRR